MMFEDAIVQEMRELKARAQAAEARVKVLEDRLREIRDESTDGWSSQMAEAVLVSTEPR